MIREAAPGDLDEIIALVRGLAEYEREPEAVQLEREQFAEHLFGEPRYAEVLIAAAEQGETVGFALFFTTYSTWEGRPGLWLEDLFVHEERRGEGHGKALLARLAAIAIERGCARLEWSVLDWNEPARGFYRSLGATEMSEWTTNRLAGEALERLARG